MPTKFEIDEQVKLEREAIRLGIKKLKENTYDLEDKSYASASVYGCSSISALLPKVTERIEKTNQRIQRGCIGKSFKEIHQYLEPIDPGAAAALALKVTFDKVFSVKPGSNKLQNVITAIGTAVEQEAQMQFYEKEAPGLLDHIKKKYWHQSIGTQQKLSVTRTMWNRKDVPQWKSWGTVNRAKLGNWLLDCIFEASNWFHLDLVRVHKKTENYVEPTPEFLAIKDEVMATAELFSPIAYPMIIPPNNWTLTEPGGYLLNEVMRGHDMVRRGMCLIQGETPIKFLNHIQSVAYTLNPFIVKVARHCMEKGKEIGKFVPIVEMPLPPKPVDIADNYESRKEYRRKAAASMNYNAGSFKRSCRTRMTMEAVDRFEKYEKFYLPWSFDYRGRAYPIPAFLTPQCTDFGKSLIRFADESFADEYADEWLSFQVATTYGLDKAPIHERMGWVSHNQQLIKAIADDPIGRMSDWEGADEPWQFLAACEEYTAVCIDQTRQSTGLMVATDATCSGLQILAGLARDASTASLVNVLPSDRPQDAYKVIAEEALPHVPDIVKPHMDRKVTKRTVMTVPYNAKPHSNRSYIREALKEKDFDIDKDDLTATVRAVRDAMDRVVPGPMRVMKWIEDEVAAAFKRGAEELQWSTPSGFVVVQRLMKPKVKRLRLQLLGKVEIKVADGESDAIDVAHHRNATSPNLIHSLDASLLHLSALRFNAPISLIHDSVLCRATDMSSLSSIVRETYMHLFAKNSYLESWAEQIGAETKPPIIGTLNPESVIESTYFFC